MFGLGWQVRAVVWLIIAACVVAVFGGVFYKGRLVERAEWQVRVDREAKERLEKEVKAQALAQSNAVALAKKLEEQDRVKQNEINAINTNHRRIVASLRQRLSRPTSTVSADKNTAVTPGCTGAELHREDGQFLAGEAARGDLLRAELLSCYAQYDKVRNLLNGEDK